MLTLLAQAADTASTTPPGLIRLYVILGYFALLLMLGGVATSFLRKGKEDFMLASHSIGPFLLLMSLFGTTMTAFAMVGSSGEAFAEGIGVYGMLASSSGIIHSLCFFVIGVKVWQFGKRYGYTTQIQFFQDRLESRSIGLFLFPLLIGLLIPYLLGGVIASGTVLQALTAGAFPDWFPNQNQALAGGVPQPVGAALVCLVVLIYVFFGGMRGTAWANTFQTMVFMVLGVITFYTIAMKLGKGDTIWESMQNAIANVPSDKISRGAPADGSGHAMSQSAFLTYIFIPLSVGMFPHLFQHWLTAKSASSFKLPVVLHPFFIMIVWVPCVLIGVWASAEGVLPPPFYKAPDEFQNKVLGFLVTKHTTPIMGGLLASGILAAVMSSLDSQFLCAGTIFTTDIYDRFFKREKGETSIWVARSFILAIVLVTYVFSLIAPGKSVFSLSIWCFSGYAALFPLIFAAIYWRRLTKAGAIAGILAMAGTWGYFFYMSGFGQGIKNVVNGTETYLPYKLLIPGTEYEVMPVVPIIVATTLVMVLVSLVTPKPSDETIKRFFPEKVA